MKTSSYPEIEYWSRLLMEDDGIVNEKTKPNGTIDMNSKYMSMANMVSSIIISYIQFNELYVPKYHEDRCKLFGQHLKYFDNSPFICLNNIHTNPSYSKILLPFNKDYVSKIDLFADHIASLLNDIHDTIMDLDKEYMDKMAQILSSGNFFRVLNKASREQIMNDYEFELVKPFEVNIPNVCDLVLTKGKLQTIYDEDKFYDFKDINRLRSLAFRKKLHRPNLPK